MLGTRRSLILLVMLLCGCGAPPGRPDGSGSTPAVTVDTACADGPHVAQLYRQAAGPVTARGDTIVAEAEEFQGPCPGWRAQPWGANYYAATLANTFLSRKAFLGAPESGPPALASVQVNVAYAGHYLALVRYEAASGFETRFRLRIEQDGAVKFDRLYGARENVKVWPFARLQKELPSGSLVWEGHDAGVDLDAGLATLTLIAEPQPPPAARRHVDLVVLTMNQADVRDRIANESYLPLDGMLTQAADLYLRVRNDGADMVLTINPGREHSPYWVHLRRWKAMPITVPAGAQTDWIEVGSLLDSLNDGQWVLEATSAAPFRYRVEFGIPSAGAIQPIGSFEGAGPRVFLAYDADTRYRKRIRPDRDVLLDLVAWLKRHPVPGDAPKRTIVYAIPFDARPEDPVWTGARAELQQLLGVTSPEVDAAGGDGSPRGYLDVHDRSTAQLATVCQELQAKGLAHRIGVVSLGDEIELAVPPAATNEDFRLWAEGQGLKPADIDPTAGNDWSRIRYDPSPQAARARPSAFYHSRRYQHAYGIRAQKARTDVLRACLPSAGIGANYSPHRDPAYLGATHQWVSLFRAGGMTMPWGEDWIFQLPVGSQQMNFINLDLFRAGLKDRPAGRIHYYVMAHWPGNTPRSWRRQFYGDLGHGMKIVNLFELRPVQAAYTENHVSLPEMYQEVRIALRELATFEDLVQDGRIQRGRVALWFSEVSDIWADHRPPFAAAKRTLYIAIRHQQLPLDIVVEEDAVGGALKDYRVLYLADQHVSQAGSRAIADWVAQGGRLVATAGAGMLDELDRPNRTLRRLLGVTPAALEAPADGTVRFEKLDLPLAPRLDTVTWNRRWGVEVKIPVVAARARFSVAGATVQGTFSDGSPAVSVRTVGAGQATYWGFLPGLSYFLPAIPKRPVDQGTTDDAMAHLVPTAFDAGARALFAASAAGVDRPVIASEPLVESSVIEAAKGTVIVLTNWSGQPVKALALTVAAPVVGTRATLASGQPVRAATVRGRRVYTLDLDVADALVLR